MEVRNQSSPNAAVGPAHQGPSVRTTRQGERAGAPTLFDAAKALLESEVEDRSKDVRDAERVTLGRGVLGGFVNQVRVE
jgi:hypothetical protein